MSKVAVTELKARLSRYLSRVRAGEEILVTDRNVPIARLVPVKGADVWDEEMRELERQGLIRLGKGRLSRKFWEMPRGQDPQGLILKALLEERRQGR